MGNSPRPGVDKHSVVHADAVSRERLHRLWSRLRGELDGVPDWLLGLLVLAVMAGVYVLLNFTSKYYWYLPSGARFAALLFLPRRYWAWVILGEWLQRWLLEVHGGSSYHHRLLTVFPQPLSSLVAVTWLRRKTPLPRLGTPAGMLRLLTAIMLSAALECLANINYVLFDATLHTRLALSLPMFATTVFLGDLMGVLVIAPLSLVLARWRTPEAGIGRLVFDAVVGLLIPALGFYVLETSQTMPLARDYLRVLITLPAVYFAFRYGWRGAAITLTLLSITVARFHVQFVGDIPGEIAAVQMLLAVMGSGALVFGSAIDALREHRRLLALQNVQLLSTNMRLEVMARELREAARRNLQLEEAQRRRIAIELHDELGQNLTALQTRVRLASDELGPQANGRFGEAIDAILVRMRQSLRGLLDTLRPAALDEFGLHRALREGPIKELLDQAGVAYHFSLYGEPALLDALDDDTRIAAWRMVQEAATNAVKYAHASNFSISLRVGLRGDSVWLLLDIHDDGIGLAATRSGHRGHGLQGMRDRMLALNGVFRISDTTPGTRLRVLLRQPLAENS